jgi:hypothetical protein
MKRLGEVIEWQTHSGSPVTVGNLTVTPQSQALTVRWLAGGLVWNRPVAVLVEREGQTERIPIIDVTRVVQAGLLGLSLGLGIVTFFQGIRHRRNRHERKTR